MESVEVHRALWWTCPDCGIDNFARMINVEDPDLNASLAQERRENIAERLGCDPDEIQFDGDDEGFMEMPTEVACKDCKQTFEVDYGDWDGTVERGVDDGIDP